MGILFLGVLLGFFVAQNMAPIEKLKIIKEQIVDTIYKSKIVEIPIETEIKTIDTVFITNIADSVITEEDWQNDTIFEDVEPENEDSIQIKKDEKMKSETLTLKILKEEEIDTLLEKLLNVESVKIKQLYVEYWESPLNYKGYKLSKSKLIVYGIKPVVPSVIYKSENTFFFKANNLYYELIETTDFKALKSIPKPDLIHD